MKPLALLLALLLLLPFSAGPAAAAPTGRFYRLTSDLGVPADRGVNVADRISQAIDRLAPGDTLLFEGMYRVDWGIRVGGKSRGTLARADGIAEAGGFAHPWSPYFQIGGSDDVAILNLTIRGPNRERRFSGAHFESAHGFSVLASQRIRLAGARVVGVPGG